MPVTVITPTNDNEKLKLPRIALKNQTIPFEWIICSREDPGFPEARWIKDEFPGRAGRFWSLNVAYNALFREAKGDIIVTLQDNIWVRPDGLEKFQKAVEETGAFVSGVGDQYQREGKYGKPEIKIWNDPRKTDKYGSFYKCTWNDIEWNWAAFPKKVVEEVGGMDEALDYLGYGGDQLQFMERAKDSGFETYLDQSNESFTLRHGRRDGWDEHHIVFNGKYDERKRDLKEKGEWPKLTSWSRVVQ